MGKKKKMNRLISRWWMKSDLPDDDSPVLLLGVAKIPTSPKSVPRRAPVPQAVPPVESSPKKDAADIALCKAVVKRKFVVTPCKENISPVTEAAMDPAVAVSTDWSSKSGARPPPHPEARLPSYLSLACTVNGYSSTTNYDPDRLARSRDTSPHRPFGHHAPDGLTATYTVCNNLLSPPNLVPLPPVVGTTGGGMSENGVVVSAQTTDTTFRHEYRHQLKSAYNITMSGSDSVDACGDGFKGPIVVEELSNGKSFIQQRVERLYGPGALAQGFFVMKKQKSKSYEIEHIVRNGQAVSERHSKSMNEQTFDDGGIGDTGMRQSCSTPSLPVLRHLRPEFRAQLPITVPKRRAPDGTPSRKSPAVPTLSEEEDVTNDGTHADEMNCGFITESTPKKKTGGNKKKSNDVCDRRRPEGQKYGNAIKDGHYFMTVLEKETKRLLALAMKAEEELESLDLNEDAKGFLRSASGKARLLVSQKMQQFQGLCRNNITQVAGEAFPTTNEDLQGFWDMIMLQVRQIDDLFAEIDRLKQNNWEEESPKVTVSNTSANGKGGTSRKVVKTSSRPISAVAEENRRLREIQRKKMIEEKRRAMKEQQQTPRQSIEIFVPESS